jgi:hypothetical protein
VVDVHGQFIDEGNVDVALTVFDYFGGLGGLDGRRGIDAGNNDRPLQIGHASCEGGGVAGVDLDHLVGGLVFIIRIDPLRGVAHGEVLPPYQSALPFKNGTTYFLRWTRVDDRFVDDQITDGQILTDQLCYRAPEPRVGLPPLVNWRRHGDDYHVARREIGEV